jgi:two-component system cell cycle response regulator
VGFTALVTKPLEIAEIEAKIAKAMNLDTSQRYFSNDGQFFMMRLPENTTQLVVAEVTHYLKTKVAEAVDTGINKAIFDLKELKRLDMTVIKLLFQAMQTCRDLALQFCLVGNTAIITECKGFEDTRSWQFYDSMDEARASFAKGGTAPATPAPAAQPAGV